MRMRFVSSLLATLLNGAALPAMAIDYSLSGYGTLGYARSDQPYTYQRFIGDTGTFKRDSVGGLQVDAKLADRFSATIQAKLAAAAGSDNRYEATVSWAFLTYRPTNDWLIRLGKQRIPLYLYSETYDVGATYDFARLPTEMYSIAPSNDATGLSVSKSWPTSGGEVTLDAMWGKSANHVRYWMRDDIPGVQQSGAGFARLDFTGAGLFLTYKSTDQTFRVGVVRAVIKRHDGTPLPIEFPFVFLGPGVGYYQVDPSLPGPGVATADSVTNTVLTIGADVALPSHFRIIAEFASSKVPKTRFAPQGTRGYASLLRQMGHWNPYVAYSFLRSGSDALDVYDKVNGNTVPAAVPGAALINASQRAGADQVFVFDQHSWALGTSYSFSATSKLKAEVSRTRVGRVSSLVDAPPGSDIRHQDINVLTLVYSVVF